MVQLSFTEYYVYLLISDYGKTGDLHSDNFIPDLL